jgi:transposase InsO family protein
MADLCGLFGVSKQAYYKYNEDQALAKAARVGFALQYARGIRELAPGMGSVKIWHMYNDDFRDEVTIGRDTFCNILNDNGMKLRARIMEDNIHYHFNYLSLILDAYSEEIVGWNVGPALDATYPIEALKMSLKRIEGKNVSLIHHSDRGCQYASREYVNILKERGIQVSMTESGDPKDNAQAERINNTMKNELLKDKIFWSLDEVVAAVAVAVDFYNNRRPHMSIGMMTPAQTAESTGDRDMRWRSFRMEAIKSSDNLNIPESCLPLSQCHGSAV